jgi:tRNA G10  N-methylase Trm11
VDNTYCFALGTNHTLCKVEILNVLDFKKIQFKIVESSRETLIITTPQQIETFLSIDDFGSTAKIIKIFTIFSIENFYENLIKSLTPEIIGNLLAGCKKERIIFGLSLYHSGIKFKELNKIWPLMKKISQRIKQKIENQGKTAWGLPINKRVLSTVAVDKNLISRRGAEFVICAGPKLAYFGKTLAVQNYKSYSFRDYGRPKRNPKAGMVPPKIAKIMINLARKDKQAVFLDPFCGCGTILQELILLGYKKIIGSDIDQTAIENTKINLEWLFKNYYFLKKENYQIKLIISDVLKISSSLPPKSIDTIVTEPFLGDPKLKFASESRIFKEVKELEIFYSQVFKEFKKILKDDGVIVIIFPVFRFKNKFFHLEILEEIKKMGFQSKNFLPEGKIDASGLGLEITPRNSIIYYRPKQTVSREIFIFQLK